MQRLQDWDPEMSRSSVELNCLGKIGNKHYQWMALAESGLHMEDRYEKNIVFEGIGGRQMSSYGPIWPIQVGPQRGLLRTQIIPGRSPLLISNGSLAALNVMTDHRNARFWLQESRQWLPLRRAPKGCFLVELFDFVDGGLSREHGQSEVVGQDLYLVTSQVTIEELEETASSARARVAPLVPPVLTETFSSEPQYIPEVRENESHCGFSFAG